MLVGNHWNAVAGQEFSDTQDCIAHGHGAQARYQKIIFEAVSDRLNLYDVAKQFCTHTDLGGRNL
jgi:hypothetical protein